MDRASGRLIPYAGGLVDPLFPETWEDLRRMQKSWDFLLELYNGYLTQQLGKGRQMDVGVLEREWQETAAKDTAAKDTAFVVDLAEAETLRLMGEVDAASDLMASYV